MKHFLILIALFIFHFHNVSAQGNFMGLPVIEYFSTEDYDGGIQNYGISQDFRGIIYIANNLGLLEYDGTNWRRHGIEKGTKVRSVFTSPSGRIYIGAQNEIGYFFPSENGVYKYYSLNHLVPQEYENFDDIWNIYLYNDEFVFTGTRELFFFNEEKQTLRVMPIPNAMPFTFKLNGNLYVQFVDGGLKKLEGNDWNGLGNRQIFDDKQIAAIARYDKEYYLVGTTDDGLFLVNDNEVVKWAATFQNDFNQHKINSILRLRDGSIAVGTNTNGLYILDKDGSLILNFTKDMGLKNGTVLSIFEDAAGHIWLGLNNGIAKIEWQSPYSFINEKLGLQGTGYTSYSRGNYIYFGTNNGLFYREKGSGKGENSISEVRGIKGLVHSIQNISGDLLVAAHFGAYRLSDESIEQFSDQIGWWEFVETSNPNLMIGGNYDGIYLFEKSDERWNIKKKYDGFSESSRVMEFDASGRLWMTHGYKGVFAFNFSDDFLTIEKIQYYGSENGFPSNLLINVYKIDQKLIFAAETGIYSFDPVTDQFIPQEKYNSAFGASNHVREIVEDSFGNLFFIATEKSGILRKDSREEFEIETNPFQKIHGNLNDDLEDISILDDENILFASKDGFIHFNSVYQLPEFNLNLLIREVTISNFDSLIFGGNFHDNEKVLNQQQASSIPELPYRFNSITLNYSATDYNQSKPVYRYTLDGFNKDKWSEWTKKSEKEYTNLDEGIYTFKVEAKDTYGNTSNIQSFNFKVLPPWYRSWFAFLGYFLFGTTGFAASIVISQRKIRREKNLIIDRQKVAIRDREDEIAVVSKTSREEIQKLRTEKLKAEIKHKNRELATQAMHLIDKNSFISSIKTNLNEIINDKDRTQHSLQLGRIVRNIDRNIDSDSDWKQFEMHFDEVHEEFLKKLRTDHPQITPQEVKLSAYLRMNMSTKEIANLLRISVRGVEIARYRLRKKLDLPKEANLVDYMMNY